MSSQVVWQVKISRERRVRMCVCVCQRGWLSSSNPQDGPYFSDETEPENRREKKRKGNRINGTNGANGKIIIMHYDKTRFGVLQRSIVVK